MFHREWSNSDHSQQHSIRYQRWIYLGYKCNLTLHSQSMLQVLENITTENGGGIYASGSSFINLGFKSLNSISQTSNSTTYFYGNRAKRGGGLYLELNSTVCAFPCLNNVAYFDKNSATYGGAVFVSTATGSTSQYYSAPNCYFQTDTLQNARNTNITNDTIKCIKHDKSFHFSLYKDAFNNCSMDGRSFEEFKLLSIMSNIQISDVGSSQIQICFCENGLLNCSRQN